MRQVLSVASECAPLVKTGGLADVVGALPAALAPEGWQLRTLLPGYPAVMKKLGRKAREVRSETDLMGGPARLLAGKAAGLDLLVLDAPHLFDREGTIYLGADGKDWPDNPERFAALSWVAAQIAAHGVDDWRPEVLHLHDWQAGLVPVYLRDMEAAQAVGTLLTIHNIAFHGTAPAARLKALRLPQWGFHPDGFEYYGKINALKAGLVFADKLSTVSPTYARELMRPEFGMGLDGVLRTREADLVGILNGIDETVWDPQTDPQIANYASPKRKRPNRKALLAEFGLTDSGGPLAIVISRLENLPRGVVPKRGSLPPAERTALFAEMAEKASATVVRIADAADVPRAVADYLREHNLPASLRIGGDPLLRDLPWSTTQIEVSHGPSDGTDPVGMSHAAAGVAETGTLVLSSGPDNPTTINFLPETHVVLVKAEDIAGDYESVWDTLRARYGTGVLPRTVNFVTGPSRSADIEQTLLLGAHGPRRLHILIVG